MNKKLRDKLNEIEQESDPRAEYNRVGKQAEQVREYYFEAFDALERLKLSFAEPDEDLDELANKVIENTKKIRDLYKSNRRG